MPSSTENKHLSDYQRGWHDALSVAMRIVGRHYVSYFHDPFYVAKREVPLIMSSELRDLRAEPPKDPTTVIRPVKISHAEQEQ